MQTKHSSSARRYYRRSTAGKAGVPLALVVIALVFLFGAWNMGYIDRWLYESSLEKAGQASSTASPNEGESSTTSPYYVYSQLDETDQKKYRIVLEALETREGQPYPSDGMEDLNRIFQCVQADHPELFYVDGVSMETVTNRGNGLVERVTITGRFAYTREDTEVIAAQINAAADICLAGVPIEGGDYAKSKYLYEWLAKNVVYDHATADTVLSANEEDSAHRTSQTIEGVFIRGEAVCGGYAGAYQLLLQKLGIPCVCVTGYGYGAPHAWCMVFLDGAYYHVDPTWADPQAIDDRQELGYVNYDYLNLTTEDVLRTHEITSFYDLPDCVEMADNYYVHEDLMFYSADEYRFGTLAADAMTRGTPLQVRFMEEADYYQIRDNFVANGRLGSYLPRGRSYQYSFTDANRSIVILSR